MAEPQPTPQNVKVFLRIRPTSATEVHGGARDCISTLPGRKQVRLGDKAWAFDAVITQGDGQETVYRQCVEPLVAGCISGYNATVLAYGQTGSGKTYTMGDATASSLANDGGGADRRCDSDEGSVDSLTAGGGEGGDPPLPLLPSDGVIPRVLRDLFSAVERQRAVCSSIELRVTYVEIYNEEIRDLLRPSKSSREIVVREAVGGSITVRGVHEVPVASAREVMKVFAQGAINRTTGSTLMNDSSSRSHAIFTVFVEQKLLDPRSSFEQQQQQQQQQRQRQWQRNARSSGAAKKVIHSKFHLVDLAGSERAKRTGAVGQRLKESVRINQGLLALSKVISALTDGVRKRQQEGGSFFGRHLHVPYRDSKLTRLLQDSLGGNSNTTVIACVSPADCNMQESVNTMKYASKARKIENIPIVNEGDEEEEEEEEAPLDAPQEDEVAPPGQLHADANEILEMRAQISELQSQLNEALSAQGSGGGAMAKRGGGVANAGMGQDLLTTQAALLKVRETVIELSNEPTLGRKAQVALKQILALTEEAASGRSSRKSGEASFDSAALLSVSSPPSWSAVTVARELQAEVFRKKADLKEMAAELASCKEDLARDEEIFAGKLKELRKEQAAASLLRERNAGLSEELASLKEQWQKRNQRLGSSESPSRSKARDSEERSGQAVLEPPPQPSQQQQQQRRRRRRRSNSQGAKRESGRQQRAARRAGAAQRAADAATAAAKVNVDHDRLAVELEQAVAARADLQVSASATRASAARHRRRLDEASSASYVPPAATSPTRSTSSSSSFGDGNSGGLGVLGSLAALARQSEEKSRAMRERRGHIATLKQSAVEAAKLVDQYRQHLRSLQSEIEDLRRAAGREERQYEHEQLLGRMRLREDELQALLRQKAEQERVVRLKRETDERLHTLGQEVAQLEAEQATLEDQRARQLQRGYSRIDTREREAAEALARAGEAVEIFHRHLDEVARRRDQLQAEADSAAAEALAVEKQMQDEEYKNDDDDDDDDDTGDNYGDDDDGSVSSYNNVVRDSESRGGRGSPSPSAEQFELQARWYETQLQEVSRVVQQRQQMERDLQRREEAAIELRETQQTRRRLLNANMGQGDSANAMLRSSHELRTTLNGLSATIKDLDAQIIEGASEGRSPTSQRRQLLAVELAVLEAQREEALAQRAALELELEHAESGQEQLREMDDKLEALQTEIDYTDSEIRRCLRSSKERLSDDHGASVPTVAAGVPSSDAPDGPTATVSTNHAATVEVAAEGVETLVVGRLSRAPRAALAELVRQGSLECIKARLALADESARASALKERLVAATGERERFTAALRAGQAERSSMEEHLDAAAKDLRRIRTERDRLRQFLSKLMTSPPPPSSSSFSSPSAKRRDDPHSQKRYNSERGEAVLNVAKATRPVRISAKALREVAPPPPPP